jgi:alpha-galactosidase
MANIVLIGAGSVEFTRILLADLVAFPELTDSTITLHDIDEERLATSEQIANQINEVTGANLDVRAHLDRRAALEGADFVVNEIQVGGMDATLRDFEIPKKYGLRRAVGLCHSVQNTHEQLAELVGVPIDEIEFQTAGLNHQAFVLRFERNGESLYPLLDAALEGDPEGLGRRVRMEIYRQFGYFPTESSEHSAEYVPWFMSHDDQLERYRIPVDEYLRRSYENLEEYAETRRQLAAGETLPIVAEGELAPRYIHSMVTGEPRLEYGNVRNEGLIDGLPVGCCVEVPCRVDGDGVHPLPVGPVPPQCVALNRTFVNVAELTVRAALEQRRDHVYQAVMLDPNAGATLTIKAIREMVDELIEAHGDLMPEGVRGRRTAAG